MTPAMLDCLTPHCDIIESRKEKLAIQKSRLKISTGQSTEGPARSADPLGRAQRRARGLLWTERALISRGHYWTRNTGSTIGSDRCKPQRGQGFSIQARGFKLPSRAELTVGPPFAKVSGLQCRLIRSIPQMQSIKQAREEHFTDDKNCNNDCGLRSRDWYKIPDHQ